MTRKREKPRSDVFVYGKVPPQASELESAVLGAILLERDAFQSVYSFLKPESFYLNSNQLVYQACLDLFNTGEPIDLLTVVQALKKSGNLDLVGGAYYVAQLTNSVVSSANIESHARIIHQKFLARELIRVSGEGLNTGYDDTTDVFEAIRNQNKALQDLSEGISTGKEIAYKDIVVGAVVASLKARDNDGLNLVGLDTGSGKLNHHTGGWQSPDLIIIAARPGCGKTSLALDLTERLAVQGIPVGFISVEMAKVQLAWKIMSKQARISAMQIMRGNYGSEAQKRLEALATTSDLPIHINDQIFDLGKLRAWVYKMVTKYGIKILFVDYIQLLGAYGDIKSRENQIGEISRGLKQLAKELEIPIIALSQLSREAEKKSKPTLATLRESGTIEQDADQVIFIYDDPDVEFNDAIEDSGKPKPVLVEWAKFRLGSPGVMKVDFYRKHSFFDFDKYGPQEDLPF